MRSAKFLGMLILSLWAIVALAAEKPAEEPFKAGKDYDVLKVPVVAGTAAHGKIKVLEFFSAGCPGCKHFDPALQVWLLKKPKQVDFEFVPVTFHSGWDVFAKAHYAARTLDAVSYPGLFNKIHTDMFIAVQDQQQDLTTEFAMAEFFSRHGVKREDFENAYNFTPGIGGKIALGENLALAYNIYQIPTVVVAGKYKVGAHQASDNEKFLAIINFLIQKAEKEQAVKPASPK